MNRRTEPRVTQTGLARAEPFSWPIRVYYEDTDSGGIVYYANYLKFMERARTEWLRARGYEQDTLLAQGLAFAVSRLEIDYLRPARFNDALVCEVRLDGLRRASLALTQSVRRDGEDLARARVEVACIDVRALKPRRIPENLHAELANAG